MIHNKTTGVFLVQDNGTLRLVDQFDHPVELADSIKRSPGRWVFMEITEITQPKGASAARQIKGSEPLEPLEDLGKGEGDAKPAGLLARTFGSKKA